MINNKVRDIAENVKVILEKNPQTRESDESLYCAYILEVFKLDPKKISMYSILNMQFKGTIPKLESIGRARRKAQELYPALRGKNYEKRHENENEFRDFSHDQRI